jgi:hypothetical protein
MQKGCRKQQRSCYSQKHGVLSQLCWVLCSAAAVVSQMVKGSCIHELQPALVGLHNIRSHLEMYETMRMALAICMDAHAAKTVNTYEDAGL